jgi:hypothetical protein
MTSIACPSDASSTVTRSPSAPHADTTDRGQPTTDELRRARNRRNACKSTGPKTPEGKGRSSQNATTHGLTALTPPPDLARDPDFQQAKAELTEEYRPTTPTQVVLVNQLAHLTWKLDQIPRLERQLLATPSDQTTPAPLPPAPEHSGLSTPDSFAPDPTVELTARHLLQNHPTPLTRLWDHHRRLLARTQSVIRQLIQLRAHHQKRIEQDAADAAALAQSERADRANAAERAAQLRQRHLEDERRALDAPGASPSEISDLQSEIPSPTRQSAPNDANARQTTPSHTPAQNEPTRCASPSVSSVSSVAEHSSSPAQNEPTAENRPRP